MDFFQGLLASLNTAFAPSTTCPPSIRCTAIAQLFSRSAEFSPFFKGKKFQS
jgi:hypothetical protein